VRRNLLILDKNNNFVELLEKHDFVCQFVDLGTISYLEQVTTNRAYDAIIIVVNDNFLHDVNLIEGYRRNENFLNAPILIVDKSPFLIPNNMRLAFQSGAAEYIHGDSDEIEILSRIENQLNRYRRLREMIVENISSKETLSLMDRLILFMDKADNSFIIYDEEFEIEWANAGFTRMHNCTVDEHKRMFGRTLFDAERGIDVKQEVEACIKNKRSAEYVTYSQTRTGEYKWIQTTLTPIFTASGKVDRFIAIETDITKQKEAERSLNNKNEYMSVLTDNLIKMNKDLEETREKIQAQSKKLEEEQQKSEELLLNILPKEVGSQLKSKGEARPRNYKFATVLFLDFVAFSKLAKELSPKDLVNILDSYFKRFDDIVSKHHLEKIKTIGDAYMCAGGLPLSNKSNPFDMVVAAFEMQECVNSLITETKTPEGLEWNCRIGIHTGPLIAGVVGKKKYMYDIWGDTVNVAARMQQEGEIGRLNISGTTYEYIKDYFDCEYRGKIQIKNADKTDMYFVNGLKPKYSDGSIYIPNQEFVKMLNSL